jgi:hypothetical protein
MPSKVRKVLALCCLTMALLAGVALTSKLVIDPAVAGSGDR